MDDLIERAEAVIRAGRVGMYRQLLIEAAAALKAAHREIDWLHGEIDRLRVRGDY